MASYTLKAEYYLVWLSHFRVISYMHSHRILLSIIILLDVSQGEPGDVGLEGPGGAQGPPASIFFLIT